LSGTSYDGIHLVYPDKMGGMATLMLKIFMIFSILSLVFFALLGMSGFFGKLMVFFGIITAKKYVLMPNIIITFVTILTPLK
jgi:NAD(P)H-quinone oxidoreductase subunit 4